MTDPNPNAHPNAQAQTLRAFNRFYTGRIGVLGQGRGGGLLASRFSLTESRLLWELAQRPGLCATDLARSLALDAGYISRLLSGLRGRGLVLGRRAPQDGRQWQLSLSAAGRRAFATLDRRSQDQALALLRPMSARQQQELLYATARVQQLLSTEAAAAPVLRSLQPGDLGWVVSRHGALYAAEFGWDWRFEALVARMAAAYVEHFDPGRESGWIAHWQGEPMGCVFLLQARDDKTGAPTAGVAQLRMLLVEPAARGRGIGQMLVQQCHRFAAEAGYTRVRLWTNRQLLAARAIYRRAGYRLLSSEAHHSFGHAMVGEVWELELKALGA